MRSFLKLKWVANPLFVIYNLAYFISAVVNLAGKIIIIPKILKS